MDFHAAAFALCSTRAEWLTGQLLRISDGFSFIYISPSELLLCYLKVALVGAVVLAFPVLLLEIWKFCARGLPAGSAPVLRQAFSAALRCLLQAFCSATA